MTAHIGVLAVLLALGVLPAAAQQESSIDSKAATAIEWLISSPPGSYTIQLATVYGLESCLAVQEGSPVAYMHCIRSSSVPNRYFAVSGTYPDQAAAQRATQELGIKGASINSLPKILASRCDMQNMNSRYRNYCDNADRIAEERAEQERIAEARAAEAKAAEERTERARIAEARAAEARAAEDMAAEARAEQARAEQARAEQARAEQARAEQARAEQARAEQARAEKARAEQARAEQARAEQARAEQARAEQARAEQARAEQARAEQARVEQAQAAEQRDAEDMAATEARSEAVQEQATVPRTETVEPMADKAAGQQDAAYQSSTSTAVAAVTPAQVDAPSEGVCLPRGPDAAKPRRRPNYPVLVYQPDPCNPLRLSPPNAMLLPDPAPVPDRWRIVDALGYKENRWDPYNNNNPLKGDKPVFGEDWFVNLSAISDTVYEPRQFPLPVGAATTTDAGQLDLVTNSDQYLINENLIVETVLYKGDTVFRPPDHEFRLITVFNINHTVVDERGLLKADPAEGTERTEGFIGLQGAFWDYHIRNVSDRYDFDSFRIGIQPFSSDFRGFLFQDNQFGIRFFGNRDNNIFQYNLAWFRRLEKESNSGLNDITESWRDDDTFFANLYWQDFPRLGFISQASLTYNRNREADDFYFDHNQFIARPSSLGFERGRDYDIGYLGLSGDGHFGRNNLTYSAYYAFGDQSNGVFTNDKTDVSAYFLAGEFSRDYDWIRARASFLHSSGDSDPFDNKEHGFDAIFENPQFAGGDTAFFIRQNVPLIGGGRVALNGRNSIIPSLRSSKEHGQSNFTNPGLTLIGLGADLDLTPETRLSLNLNQMWFDETAVLDFARNQNGIRRNIGQDLSAALIWRPFATQNVVFRLSGAVLIPGSGFEDLYGDGTPFSVLANLILAY